MMVTFADSTETIYKSRRQTIKPREVLSRIAGGLSHRYRLKNVSLYIKEQEKHHQTLSFKDEFVRLLERHHIEYDDQYLWR